MRTPNKGLRFLLREWMLVASASGLLLTSIYFKRVPNYSNSEIQMLFILFVLFVAVKGLDHSGFISSLSRRIGAGRFTPLKLVVATFALSMLVTNDIALTVIVPLTLSLDIDRKDVLVILEALAANAGSALTPFGNPQNLFVYWFYGIHPVEFLASIAPLPFVFLILLLVSSLAVKTRNHRRTPSKAGTVRSSAYVYALLLILVVLTVLRVLPVSAGSPVLFYALLFDRKSLRVDYALLLSFFCLFGLAQNMKILFLSRLEHSGHIFLFSAISSQFMSNVPVTLLFAKFTSQWKALLWGANVGGFGSLVGSLANLIAYKLYIAHGETDRPVWFAARFVLLGYVAFFIGIGLYFAREMHWT